MKENKKILTYVGWISYVTPLAKIKERACGDQPRRVNLRRDNHVVRVKRGCALVLRKSVGGLACKLSSRLKVNVVSDGHAIYDLPSQAQVIKPNATGLPVQACAQPDTDA